MLEKKKKIVIGNWKMKLGFEESIELTKKIALGYKENNSVEVVIAPSAPVFDRVRRELHGTNIALGAQDVFYHNRGAYTGEVSPEMAQEIGCTYSLVGHSERRKLGETDDDVNRKVKAILDHNMTPIICVGETFEEYQAQKTDVVIINQVTKALEDVELRDDQRIILAYEPVWVIGSGQAVDHSIVEHIVQIIIHTAMDMNPTFADKFEVIYGGSVDYKNVNDFIIGNISTGVIVGGKSLDAEEFLGIIEAIK